MALNQRTKYQLWWDFLHIAIDRREAIDWDTYDKYRWGNVRQYTSFEKWWKEHGRLLQDPVVRTVKAIPSLLPKNTIYLEVPLNRAPSRLWKRARHIIKGEFEKAYPELKGSLRKTKAFMGNSGFTVGRRIRLDHYRQLVALERTVIKFNPNVAGKKLLEAVNAVDEKSEKERAAGRNPRWTMKMGTTYATRQIPDKYLLLPGNLYNLKDGQVLRVLRAIYRSKSQIDNVVAAVRDGRFP